MNRSDALSFRNKIEKAASTQTDIDALQSIELYPKWTEGLSVNIGDRYQYDNKLYKVVQSHTTQNNWIPDITPALWTKISIEEWPEWKQPLSASDVYMKNDKVFHNNKYWISDIDNNSWEPGVYGWIEQINNN